jgi:hypothetical protein
MFWDNWSGHDWIVAIGSIAAAVGALIALGQLFRKRKPSQVAKRGGVNVGGNVHGSVSAPAERTDDPS